MASSLLTVAGYLIKPTNSHRLIPGQYLPKPLAADSPHTAYLPTRQQMYRIAISGFTPRSS